MSRRILIGLLWTALAFAHTSGQAAEGGPAPGAIPEPAEPPESSAPTAGPTIERIEMAPEPLPPAPAGTAPAPMMPAPAPEAAPVPRSAPAETDAPFPTGLMRSAEAGDAAAQLELGILYEYGYGMKGRKVEALAWYLAAADQGNAKAIQRRDKLLRELGSLDVAAAKAKSKGIRRSVVVPRPAPEPETEKLGPPAQ
jgi:hypothetical protein